MNRRFRNSGLILTGFAVVAFATLAQAHHSSAPYNLDEEVVVAGEIIEYTWAAPHVYIGIRDETGQNWIIEGNPPNVLARNGWSRDSLTKGEIISARANPSRDSQRSEVRLISLIAEGGASLQGLPGNQLIRDADENATTDTLDGVWRGNPGDAFGNTGWNDVPLTPKGQAAKDSYVEEIEDPTLECVAYNTPRTLRLNAFYLSEFEVMEERILLRNEFGNIERTIYMDGRTHPENGERTNQGYSVGHWEDDVLVVDTRLFSSNRDPGTKGIPSGHQKRVIERFEIADNGRQLTVHVSATDPEFLLAPFVASYDWFYSPHLQLDGFDCDTETAGRYVH